MGAAIAIISVVASATVAIVVAVLASRGETARLKLQISAERLNELRAVLDESASALSGALYEMNGIVSLLDQELEQALGGGPTVENVYSDFQDRFAHASRLRERIALRLGPRAELVGTYAAGVDACQAFFNVWGERWRGSPWNEQLSSRANQAVADGERAHAKLLEIASAMVGPSLGDDRP
ncbi:MAG: hypothetical protein QOJ29_4323 [Thermoleophilaceae bacterium]|nr:hypothetical protein [Thermoleophilaceae bacterium]